MPETLFTVDEDKRTARGLVVPYDEMTDARHAYPAIFRRNTITIPKNVAILRANRDHALTDPVAVFTSVQDTPAGIVATFSIEEGEDGDALIAAHKRGELTHLSGEFKRLVKKGSEVVSGVLTGAAFTSTPAFVTAGLFALDDVTEVPATDPAEPVETTAHDEQEYVDENGVKWRRVSDTDTKTETTDTGEKTTTTTVVVEETEQEEDGVTVSQTAGDTTAAPTEINKAEAFGLFRLMNQRLATPEQIAKLSETLTTEAGLFALTDIKYSGTGAVTPRQDVPQWVGELWNGVAYQQKVASLFAHKNATAMKIAGFRWVTKPTGAAWPGNKTNIPSSTAVTEPYEADFNLWAGGHDHAIEHRLFNTPGYFESYFEAMAESFAKWQDDDVLADILAAGQEITADNPANLTIGAGMSALIDGAAQVMANDAIPTFALVAADLWKQIAKTPQNTTLGYLNAGLGLTNKEGQLDSFTFRLHPALAAGQVVVGAREAVDVYELPGAPIRIEAPDTVKGGIDTNVIGGSGTFIHKANAIVKVKKYGA